MEQSPRLSLSYVAPSQAQKHVTVNESFRRLDVLVQLSVRSRTVSAEPGAPAEGDAYILPSGAAGPAWDDYTEDNIAVYQDGAWTQIAAIEGLRAWVSDDEEFVVFDGTSWSEISGAASGGPQFGVNATADATNRLSVKSDAVLFSHDDVTPGSGDAQVKVNKASAGDTASHLFQTNFSGRAEFGLTGDDDFHIKVSPDNFSTSHEALVIGKDTGNCVFGGDVDLNGNGLVFDADGDSYLHAVADDDIRFVIGGVESKRWLSGAEFTSNNGASPAYYLDRTDAHGAGFIGSFFFRGKDSAGNATIFCRLRVRAVDVTDTSEDGALYIYNTVAGSETQVAYFQSGLVVGSPAGGDKGPGTINAQAVYDDNTLLTCYVFDQALDGAVSAEKWDGKVPGRRIAHHHPETGEIVGYDTIERTHEPMRKFAARAGTKYDPLTLDGYAKHWREKRHLTSMPNEAAFDPQDGQLTTGEWIQRLVETVEIQAVLIEEANRRLKALEAVERVRPV